SDSAGEEHVAKLRDGGVGEDALDVVLHHANACCEDGSGGSDDGDYAEGVGRAVEDGVSTGDHVDACGDHGGGVDERGDRGGAFHRVREPDIERDLCGFAGGTDDEEESDGGKETALPLGVRGDGREDR